METVNLKVAETTKVPSNVDPSVTLYNLKLVGGSEISTDGLFGSTGSQITFYLLSVHNHPEKTEFMATIKRSEKTGQVKEVTLSNDDGSQTLPCRIVNHPTKDKETGEVILDEEGNPKTVPLKVLMN